MTTRSSRSPLPKNVLDWPISVLFELERRDVDELASLIGKTVGREALQEVGTNVVMLGYELEDLAGPAPIPLPAIKEERVVDVKRTPKTCYRRELISCGKPRCRCASGGELHGPYWYAYWRTGARVSKRYVGKTLSGENL